MFLNQLKGKERDAFMFLAHTIILSDGIIVQQEKDMMQAYCLEMALESYDYNKEFENEAWDILCSLSSTIKKSLYIEFYALAICEGDFSESEKLLLKNICKKFDISLDESKELQKSMDELNEVYAQMHRLIYD